MKILKIVAETSVGLYGQQLERIKFTLDSSVAGITEKNITLTGACKDFTGKVPINDIISVMAKDEDNRHQLIMEVVPFPYKFDFRIGIAVKGEHLEVGKEDIDEAFVKNLDRFQACRDKDVIYRLYQPEAEKPRPLILFLHGGGECGTDNEAQMIGTLGAIKLAERYPDMYIMAPQAPDGNGRTMEENLTVMMQRGDPFRVNMGDTPFALKGERGWNRDYLAKVCGVIHKMIAKGVVDAARVYVIGLSMGGGGTITACSVDHELFAAAVAICPSMNGETYSILRSFPKLSVWIAASYVDHQKARASYILDACEKLWIEGRKDVKFSIFTPDELGGYGLGVNPELTVKELLEENHNVWVPVLYNERGILDWMVSNVRNRQKEK